MGEKRTYYEGINEKYYQTRLLPNLPRIRRLTKRGVPKAEVCKRLGLKYDRVLQYQDFYPDVREAFLDGMRVQSDKVAVSLLKSATGYKYNETERIYDENGDMVMMKVKEKYNPPNMGAINRIFKMFEQYYGVDERLKSAQTKNVDMDASLKRAALDELQNGNESAPIVALLQGLNTIGVRPDEPSGD